MFFRTSTARLQRIDNYFGVQQWWIRIVGMAEPEQRRHRVQFAVYKLVIVLIMAHITVLFTVTVYLDILSGSFRAVAYSLPQMVIMLISTFYLAYFQANTAYYFDLMGYMNAHFRFRSAKGLTYVTSQWAFEVCNLVTNIWPLVALSSTGIVSLLPLFQNSRSLPLNCWYPFDPTVSPYYQLLYVSQVLVQIIMPLSFCVSMTVPLVMAFLLCSQYDVLCCSLRNLPWTAMRWASPGVNAVYRMKVLQLTIPIGVSYAYSHEYRDTIDLDETFRFCPRKITGPTESYNTALKDQLHEVLCDCIRLHQCINACCDRMEAVNNPYALVKILEISFQICVLALAIVTSAETLLGNMANVLYLAMTVVDLFLLCYLGQIIESQSMRVRDFLYETPWEAYSAPFRRTMLIMMQYTLRPKVMTGGKFFALSYEKFVATMKLSFSYFTLIQSMGEE